MYQRIDDFLSDAISEIGLVTRIAQIGKGQHRDRWRSRLHSRFGCARLGPDVGLETITQRRNSHHSYVLFADSEQGLAQEGYGTRQHFLAAWTAWPHTLE